MGIKTKEVTIRGFNHFGQPPVLVDEIERLRGALEDISELDPNAEETPLSAVHMADAALHPEKVDSYFKASPKCDEGKEQ